MYTPSKKRTYEEMYAHTSRHGIKRALQRMAREEDARTILEALDHVSNEWLASFVARALRTRS
jgi:hypothetical protein